MVSQRTVGKFQYLLEQMFQNQGYGIGCGLTPATYYRLLYEANVPAELLDCITKHSKWNPYVLARALHEGVPIAIVRQQRQGGSPNPTDAERETGDGYLLSFAEVALSQYVKLSSEEYFRVGDIYRDAAQELFNALRSDGYTWDRQTGITGNGSRNIPLPLVPVQPVPEITPPALEQDEASSALVETNIRPRQTLSLVEWCSLVTVIVAILSAVAAWFTVPEFREHVLHKKYAPAVQQRDSRSTEQPQLQEGPESQGKPNPSNNH
jgi:hypothetical protein